MSTTMQAVPRPRGAAGTLVRAVLILLRARAIVVLVALLVLFSSLAPSFLTANNLSILTKHVAITALLALGMTFVVLTGGIDLSVGSVAGLGGMAVGYVLTQGITIGGTTHYPNVLVAVSISLCLCLLVGALTG